MKRTEQVGITKGDFNTKTWTPKTVEVQATTQRLSDADLKNILHSLQQGEPQGSYNLQSVCSSSPVQVDVAALTASMRQV